MAENKGDGPVQMDNQMKKDKLTQLNRSADRFKEGMEESLMKILKDEEAEMDVASQLEDGKRDITILVADLINFFQNPPEIATTENQATKEETEGEADFNFMKKKVVELSKTMETIEKMSKRFKKHAKTYQEAIMDRMEEKQQEMAEIEEALCKMQIGMSEVAQQLAALNDKKNEGDGSRSGMEELVKKNRDDDEADESAIARSIEKGKGNSAEKKRKLNEVIAKQEDGETVVAEAVEEEIEDEERKNVAEVMDRTKKLIESFKRHSKSYQEAAMAMVEKSKQEKEWVEFAVDVMLTWLSEVAVKVIDLKDD